MRKSPLHRMHRHQNRRLALMLLLAALCFTSVASAQLPAARLTSIFPPGAKAGSILEVTVSGADLDGASEIRFSAPGMTATPVDQSDSETDRKFTVKIAATVPPGNYEARVAGRFGVTNPRGFVVGDLPELSTPAKPDVKAVSLPLNTVMNGRCPANMVDEYALNLKQGQRVSIECRTRELDSRLVPVMTLIGPKKEEVARSRKGGLIDFTAPVDAVYTLRVHDLIYKGGAEYVYRLVASTAPHIDSIFPPSGLPGKKGKFTLLGRNLPGSTLSPLRALDGTPLEQLDVDIELPADASASPAPDALALLGAAGAGIDATSYRLKNSSGISNPVLIGFARAPLIVEQEPNDSADHAQRLTVPCEVAGRFYPHGDRDVYTFSADKGEVYWIEIISARLGQPTSPELLVQMVGRSEKGVEQLNDVQDIGGPDMQPMGKRGGGASAAFPVPSRDIEYRLESKTGGTCRLTVRDLFDSSEDDPSLVYRLVIHKQSPDFHLVATTAPLPPRNGQNNLQEPNPAPPFLRKGGATIIRVNVLRQDGFDGEVQVSAEGLPAGIKCAPAIASEGESATNLVLLADENAAAWVGTIRITGKATIDGAEKIRTARIGAITSPGSNQGNGNAERAQSRLCGEMPLAISADESEAVSLDLPQTVFEARAGEKLQIPVKVKRRIALKQPLNLQVQGLPRSNNNKKNESAISAESDNGMLDLDLTQQRLSPGIYTFYLQAQAQMKYDRDKGVSEKAVKGDGAKAKKRQASDSLVTFYSPAITLKILPK